ncbi:MAG: aminopeptidase [Chitinivibrionales bacterium]|nr:aminopeptidase [Chitinivibrionales bacterium]
MVFTQTQLERYADVLLWGLQTARTKPFKAYDKVILRIERDALDLAEVVHRKILEKQWVPVMKLFPTPTMEKQFYTVTDQKQRRFIGPWDKSLYENANGSIVLSAPASLTHLKEVDPKRINDYLLARKTMRKIMEQREEKGLLGWTLCTIPTRALAEKASLSIKAYTNQIIRACYLDETDPVKKWAEIHRESQTIKKWLNSLPVKSLRLESSSCDLTISLGDKRRWMGVSGHNIPSFELFTSPDWRGTDGAYCANLPSYQSGNLVSNIKLVFKKGNVISAEAEQGGPFLKQMIAMDAGAKRLGEFSLTDKRFSRINKFMADTLFDENFGGSHGNSHIAVGQSYSDTYNGNVSALTAEKKRRLGFNTSALHWDMVNTEDKTVTAIMKDGSRKIIYEHGSFLH